jgi:hypothetical protein
VSLLQDRGETEGSASSLDLHLDPEDGDNTFTRNSGKYLPDYTASHFLDNRLTDGGEVVSLTRRPPGTHFCYRQDRSQGHNAAGRIRSIEKSNDLIGNRTHDFPTCSIVPQPTRYRVPHLT